MIRGYDIDGVITAGVTPESDGGDPVVIISGRTWPDWDDTCRRLALSWPVYIRGSGEWGDRRAAGLFKATMITLLGVEEFFEDDADQAAMIADRCRCHVRLVTVVAPEPNGTRSP